jgi:unsaturated chondroitin disaccharide hydrolase
MGEKNADRAGLAIVDCMMNLPLLFWAAQETGNRFYSEIAVKHADTTLRCFIRSDDSIYHAYRFDLATGAPLGGDNYCGCAVESHWARGTAWAIYGFALAYGYTRDAKYLDASYRLARKFLSLMDSELVPVWDFRLPKGTKRLRDSSAAAVAVCGFNELLEYRPRDGVMAKAAGALLGKLCSDRYLDANVRCPGVLKNAQIGDGVGKAQNTYASWGDYFFMEALAKKLYAIRGYW